MYFILFILFIIAQRLTELVVARRNQKWLESQGAIEYGKEHYPFMIALHTAFIGSMIAEYWFSTGKQLDVTLLIIYLLLLSFKIWVLSSLGKYWNTRIFRVPGVGPVMKGPYKIFKHPNYFVVVCEVALIPLVFHLYYTAIIFSILNAVMLWVRIGVENKVWAQPH